MAGPGRQRRLGIALALNLAIVGAEAGFGFGARSLGLLADAAHNLTDVGTIALAALAVYLSARPATVSRSFGWHRSSVLAAQANAAVMLAVSTLIVWDGARRIANPPAVHGGTVMAVAAVALVVNGLAAMVVRGDHDTHDHGHDGQRGRDLNMRATFVHLAGDALASAGVVVAGAVILLTGSVRWLDPAVSMAIAVLIAVQAVALLREATDVLLESTPGGLDMAEIAEVMAAVDGVEEVHDIHAWSLSSDVRALSAHLVMAGHPTLEEAQAVADTVKRAVAGPFGIAHATLELECEACVADGHDPCALPSDLR
jgi:cobalt-zinc-cadmium efflux system protein